jgi:lycopene cyclase domain-containing protein
LRYLYYIFNALVIAGPATLLFIAKDKVTLNLRAFALAFLYVCMPFIVWDMWAASNEHWGFNPRYIIGPYIFKLPIEEMLFFVTVPFAMTFVWELMASRVKDINNPKIIQCILWVVVIVLSLCCLLYRFARCCCCAQKYTYLQGFGDFSFIILVYLWYSTAC